MKNIRPHLRDIVRYSSADIEGNFIRMDRNERVTPMAEKLFSQAMASVTPKTLSSYPNPKKLHEIFSKSIGLPSNHVLATNGCDGAIRRVFHTFVGPGDQVLRTAPNYAMYDIYAQIFEARQNIIHYGPNRAVPASKFMHALDESPQLACMVNPNQPTGAYWSQEELKNIISKAATKGVLCLVDETYYPCHPETIAPWVREFDNLIVTRSFSKVYGLAGLRLGFAIAQPQLIEALGKVQGLHEVNAVAISVGTYFLENPRVVQEYLDSLEAGREQLRLFARKRDFGFPHCPTNFQLIDLNGHIAPSELAQSMEQRGFRIQGNYSAESVRSCIRITLDGPEIMSPFVASLEKAIQELLP